ncbi:MAG TPA: AAA family ATPase, partial [bacterium]
MTRLTPSRVKGLRRRQDRFEPAKARGVSPLYGRNAELATLRSCLTQAREGQGQIVAVVGEAGIGKSRLLHEFVLGLDRSQWIVLRAHCLANDQGTPYRPLKELLRRGLFLQRISAERLAVADVAMRLNAVAPALSRFLPYYLHLLDVHSAEHPIPVGVSGPALSAHLVESLAALVTHGLALRPIVMLIEDWHWADSASDAGLMTLLGMAAQYPLLIVVTHRPDYTGRWIDAQLTRIALRPLSPVDSAALAQSAAGANRLPASVTGRIHAHTEGNPLFIEELTRAYVETQVSRTSSVESDDVWAGIVSGTVQGVIRSRLSRLDEECVELLRLASVIGAQFSRRLLEQIAPPGLPVAAALERLQTSGAIRQVRVVPEPLFRFAHSIARLVVYETLLLQRRLTLHEQVGFAIERAAGDRLPDHVEALAHHYARSANALQAVRYLEAAGDKAARVFALREARRDYREALLRLRKDAPSEASASRGVDLALKWVQVSFYQPSQELVQAVEQARADAQALGDGGRLARTTFWAGALHCARGSLVQARE